MSTVLLLLNGITDRTLQDLQGKTPLEKAKLPCLHSLSGEGELVALEPPSPVSFESSLLSLLSEEYKKEVPQGPLEAFSLNIPLKRGEVAFSVRFVSCGSEVITDVADQLLTDREGELFCSVLNQHFSSLHCNFHHLSGPRAVLVSSHPLLREATQFPMQSSVTSLGMRWQEALPGKGTLKGLEELISRFNSVIEETEVNALKWDFEEAPVNCVYLSEGGEVPSVQYHERVAKKEEVLFVSSAPSSLGLAKILGLATWKLPKEEEKFSNLALLAQNLPKICQKHTLVLLDLHYLWRSTFNGDLLEKIKTIEYLDRHLLQRIKSLFSDNSKQLLLFPLTHSSISQGTPQEGAVPCLIYPSQKGNKEMAYLESSLDQCGNPIPMGRILDTLSSLSKI